MNVPTSEVSYTSATTWRGDHEVHKGHVVALEKKWNSKSGYSAHENPLLAARLNMMTAIRILSVYFFNIHFNIFFPLRLQLVKRYLSFSFFLSNQYLVHVSDLFYSATTILPTGKKKLK
jgi:hypothetical protein